MHARLLARFPHLRGLEGVFTSDHDTDRDGDGSDIAEWLIPFEDLTVGDMIGAGGSAVVLKVRNQSIHHKFKPAFMHSFIHSFIHSFMHACIHSFIRSFVRLLIDFDDSRSFRSAYQFDEFDSFSLPANITEPCLFLCPSIACASVRVATPTTA